MYMRLDEWSGVSGVEMVGLMYLGMLCREYMDGWMDGNMYISF